MNDATILILIPLVFVLIGAGLFLSFYKRKLPPGENPTAWIDRLNLPDYAKDVRRKEAAKNTARIFTPAWFKEYWQGRRTAISAWFCWLFCLPLLFVLSAAFFAALPITFFAQTLPDETLITNQNIMALVICYYLYYILASVIWWKCARNSTTFYKYVVRIWAAIKVFTSIIWIAAFVM